MTKYLYKAIDSSSSDITGEIEADSQDEAVDLLRKKNIRVLSIRKSPVKFSFQFISKVKLVDISRFTRQFAAMISAGLPLVQCMDILNKQTENKTLASAANQVYSDIQGGSSLAEALEKHPRIFNDLYCSMIAAGEKSGNLDLILVRLADYLEKAHSLMRKVKSAMTYPVIIFIVAICATVLLLTVVVPKFEQMFIDLGGNLPLPTLIVMAVSGFFQNYTLLILLIIFAFIFLLRRYYNTEKGAYMLDSILLKIPVIGDIQRKSSISRFSQTLSTLLNSGINILSALETTARTAGNKVLEKGIHSTIEKISAGQPIAEPLDNTGLFPPMVIQMIAVGEKTGDVSGMLTKVSTFYEEEVDTAVDALTSILEPIMIVLLGFLIGGILIAMYLPMFEIISIVE